MSRDTKGRFHRGSTRPPNAGRRRGVANKTTRAVKEFLAELCDDPAVQAAVRERILAGDITGFFRAIDKILPDPAKAVQMDVNAEWVRVLPARGSPEIVLDMAAAGVSFPTNVEFGKRVREMNTAYIANFIPNAGEPNLVKVNLCEKASRDLDR